MSQWQATTLGNLITLQRGHDLAKTEMKLGSIPVAGSNGVIGYHNKATTKGLGITIGRSGNIGNPHLYKEDFWAHNTTLYVKDFKGNDEIFVYYLLKSIDFAGFNVGSAVPTLNRNHIHPMVIQKPSPEEQKAIASVLSSLDDKIDLLHRQNTTLERMAETLFRQWFVEEAQEDWEVVPLGDAVETTSGGTPSRSNMDFYLNGTINWVKSKELSGSFILDTEEKITVEALKKSSAKLLPKNSILIAMYGATVGEYAIISKEMTCNQAVCALKPNEKYPYTFLFFYVMSYQDELISMAVGSAQQNISQLLIKQLPILTCHEKISEFHKKTEPFFEKIKNNISQIQTLEKLRDNLLPKLMSGEVRLS